MARTLRTILSIHKGVLFIHSNCSDGKHSSNSPRDVIEVLKSFNFEFIMITREKTYFEKQNFNAL